MKTIHSIAWAIVAIATQLHAVETMDEIVVQSTRIPTPLDLMTSSVEVITQEELQNRGHLFVSDALNHIPGISTAINGGLGQVTSIYLRGAKPQHTLILVDGVRMNGQLDLNGYDLANLDVTAIERIEILKGPQSTLYGSDALAGVINIITQKGDGKPRATLQHEVGRYQTQRTSAGVSGGDETLHYSVNATHLDTEGFSATKTDPDSDGLLNNTFSTRMGGKLLTETTWDAHVRYINAEAEYDAGLYEKEQLVTRLQLQHQFNQKLSSTAAISYLDLERVQYATDYLSDTLSYEWNLTAQPNSQNTLLLGTDGYEDQYSFSGNEGDLDNHAFLALWQLRPDEATALNLSGRQDHHSRFGEATTYQGGISHILPTETRLHAAYGNGFKAPTSYQLTYSPTLDPEKSRGWEIGLEQPILENQCQLSATLFNKTYKHFIDYVAWINNGPSYENLSTAETDGVELAANYFLSDQSTLTIAYSYLDNDSPDSGFTARRPQHKIDTTLFLQLTPTWNVTALASHVGSRQERGNKLDSYALINLSTRYKLDDNITLFARLENLLNETYETALDFSFPPLGYNAPGRSFYGGISLEL